MSQEKRELKIDTKVEGGLNSREGFQLLQEIFSRGVAKGAFTVEEILGAHASFSALDNDLPTDGDGVPHQPGNPKP